MLQLIAALTGRHPGWNEGDDEKRERLLAPIIEQNKALHDWRQAHPQFELGQDDIDPDA